MVRPDDEEDSTHTMSSEDDLARLIRWSLEDSISGAEPPADVWPRILGRVREMSAPAHPKRSFRTSSFPLGAFVQAVVVSALLLAFGLGGHLNVVMPQREHGVDSTPTVIRKVRPSEEVPEDMLRGHVLARMQQGLLQRMGGEIR
jgi:hypothetical protein